MYPSRTMVRRAVALVVGLATLVAATGSAGALVVDDVPRSGSTIGASHYASAVYSSYPGGYFAVRGEPAGSTWDNDLMSWFAGGVVNARCGSPGNLDYPSRSGDLQDGFSQPVFVVDPTMSQATGTIRGRAQASSCGNAYDFVLTFSMQATSLPAHGEIVDPSGYVWGYVQRSGTATGTFCWDNGRCTAFGVGQSVIGYRYVIDV